MENNKLEFKKIKKGMNFSDENVDALNENFKKIGDYLSELVKSTNDIGSIKERVDKIQPEIEEILTILKKGN